MKVGVAGGIEAVVKAISTHVTNAGVREKGCGALKDMSANNSISTDKSKQKQTNKCKMKRTVENRVKAGVAGEVEAVVKVINTHMNNICMCKQGCRVLGVITSKYGKTLK